ncbi:MAG: alpha/beta fold hydrolase [Microbacterium enclense]
MTFDELRADAERAMDEVRRRIAQTRFPDPIEDHYGVSSADVRAVLAAWSRLDWRGTLEQWASAENAVVDTGLGGLHVLRRRPAQARGTIVLLHGWPSSFAEMDVLARELASPRAAGREPFDVLVPSLPGFGLSSRRPAPGPNHTQTADALAEAIRALTPQPIWVHAYDIAAGTAVRLAQRHPDLVRGYHTTEPGLPQLPIDARLRSREEVTYLEKAAAWDAVESGYMAIQSTRPTTLAYGLQDSPVGLAAWMLDKWRSWSESPGRQWRSEGPLFHVFLETLMLYWATGTVGSANRVYYRQDVEPDPFTAEDRVTQPVSVTLGGQEIERAPRAMAERLFTDIVHWNDLGIGGHFIAAEMPELVADSLRRFITTQRV